MILQRMISVVLAVILVLLTGFASVAHDMPLNCNDGHCDEVQSSERSPHLDRLSPTGHHETDGADHDGCNPFLCNLMLLASETSDASPDQFEQVLNWQVSELSALREPEHPDRPPNF